MAFKNHFNNNLICVTKTQKCSYFCKTYKHIVNKQCSIFCKKKKKIAF